MNLSELVACTLGDTGLKSQRERWASLVESFAIGREATADGLRLRFRDHEAVEAELRALVAVENECCSWAAWTVERDEDALLMCVRSRAEGVAVLQELFAVSADAGRTGANVER